MPLRSRAAASAILPPDSATRALHRERRTEIMNMAPKIGNSSLETAVRLTRILPMPRARVFAAWTRFDRLKRWWGPEGVKTHELVFDTRERGVFRWVWNTPGGERMAVMGVFRAVQPGEKLVFTWQSGDAKPGSFESLVTVDFLEMDASTAELRLTHEYLPDEESRDEHAFSWNSALDNLEILLASG